VTPDAVLRFQLLRYPHLTGGLALVARLPSDSPGVLLSGLLLMGTGCALANPAAGCSASPSWAR
jgi:hypothetical protein